MAAKTWVDTPTSGTPITADDLNRIEQTLSDLASKIDAVSSRMGKTLWTGSQSVTSGTAIEIYSSASDPFPYSVVMVVGYFPSDSTPGGQDTPYKFHVPCFIGGDNGFVGCSTSYGYVTVEQVRLVSLTGKIESDVYGGEQHSSIVFNSASSFFKLTFNVSGTSFSNSGATAAPSFTITEIIGVA